MMTMTTVLLLVSFMAPLGNSATIQPTNQTAKLRLKPIIDLLDRNISLPTGDFYSLKHLADGIERCEDKFFCKVHEILDKHQETMEIARHLKEYNNLKEFKCKDVLQQLQSTCNKYQMPLLIKDLKECVSYRIWYSPASTTAPLHLPQRQPSRRNRCKATVLNDLEQLFKP